MKAFLCSSLGLSCQSKGKWEEEAEDALNKTVDWALLTHSLFRMV